MISKTLNFIGLLALIGYTLFAQHTTSLSYSLQKTIINNSRSGMEVSVLIKGDIEQIEHFVLYEGGTWKYASGDVCAVRLPLSTLRLLAENNFVQRIETPVQHMYPQNDMVLINNRIDSIHAGYAPLTQAYDGDGVVFGMIDTGIDYDHPDFKNSDGTSRILFVWDQNDSTQMLQPYGYGTQWTQADFNDSTSTQHDTTWGGHGTWVASVAAGNGRATGNYMGAAPKADIIAVAINPDKVDYLNYLPNWYSVADAVDYIFTKADSLGKPCVINISLGGQSGSHDGLDLPAQIIANMIEAQPGRALVTSAGNQAQQRFHMGYEVTADTNFTWFRYMNVNQDYCTRPAGVYFNIFADTSDFNDVYYSISADKISPCCDSRAITPFMKIHPAINQFRYDTLKNGASQVIGIVKSFAEIFEGVYGLHFEIETDSAAYYWQWKKLFPQDYRTF